MQRPCDVCGTIYEAKRANSKFCSSTCRVRNARSGGGQASPTPQLPPLVPGGLSATVQAKLAKHDRLDTVAGQRAVFLADRAEREVSGSAVASLDRQLAAAMDAALEGVSQVADPMDELQARRDRLRAG